MSDQKITVTNDDLAGAFKAVTGLSLKQLPTMLSYRIAKIMLEIRPHAELLEEERQKLFLKYVVKENDKFVVLEELPNGEAVYKMEDEFAVEWGKLLAQETVLRLEPLSIVEFGETLEVAPVQLEILMKAGLLTE